MITVLGKLPDTRQYIGRDGFNVMSMRDDWSPELNRSFIDEAIVRGDHLLFASWQSDGQYREELVQILATLCTTISNQQYEKE